MKTLVSLIAVASWHRVKMEVTETALSAGKYLSEFQVQKFKYLFDILFNFHEEVSHCR